VSLARFPALTRDRRRHAVSRQVISSWAPEWAHELLLFYRVRPVKAGFRKARVAAPIDDRLRHYVRVRAASTVYVNAPEARLLTGIEPTSARWVETHADGLVRTMLPNLPR